MTQNVVKKEESMEEVRSVLLISLCLNFIVFSSIGIYLIVFRKNHFDEIFGILIAISSAGFIPSIVVNWKWLKKNT